MLQLRRRGAQGERVLGVLEMPRVRGCGQAGEPPLRRKSLLSPSHQKDEKNEVARGRGTGRALATDEAATRKTEDQVTAGQTSQECGHDEATETAE